MQSPSDGLFSYSAILRDGEVINDFGPRLKMRYSVNVLAGLQRAPSAVLDSIGLDVDMEIDRFLDRHLSQLEGVGNRGLLLLVLASAGRQHERLRRELLAASAATDYLRRANLQELCWLLMGLARQADLIGDPESAKAADSVFSVIRDSFMNPTTLLPYHSLSRVRRRFVSFGGITYFLVALFEYSRAARNHHAETLFRRLLELMLSFQGPDGSWAWFYDADRAKIVDRYEVYTVHQAAMAPLFLLPAVDLDIPGAEAAVERGYRWVFGQNELNAVMLRTDPFFTFRSIRRRGPLTRLRRFARGALPLSAGRMDRRASARLLAVNPECRSYEIGWLVYAWADRTDFTEFRSLELARG
jgi:hypothetical protein